MEEWNAGILGIRAEINHFNCKKLLSFNFVQDKLTHHFYPTCPACPVAPADGTGVGPADLTGVKLFSISPGSLLHHFYPVKLFSISPGPLFQLGRSP